MARCLYILVAFLCFTLFSFAQQKDDSGCKDHPLFTRMPTYWIHSCQEKEFDTHAFNTTKGKTEQVEGRFWMINYRPQATATSRPSEIQILRNYENAVKKLGGTVLAQEKNRETLRFTRDGKELWAEVLTSFTGGYKLIVVERQAMGQDIVANADAFLNDLKTTGHAAVYGIYFDTGKSALKPESEQAISEIAKLLKSDNSLKLYVVGHTDNVGGLENNMTLSHDRSEAVVQALVQTHGIAASRLKSYGAGPYAPVSSNDTEEGKAKNRRVELVKQ